MTFPKNTFMQNRTYFINCTVAKYNTTGYLVTMLAHVGWSEVPQITALSGDIGNDFGNVDVEKALTLIGSAVPPSGGTSGRRRTSGADAYMAGIHGERVTDNSTFQWSLRLGEFKTPGASLSIEANTLAQSRHAANATLPHLTIAPNTLHHDQFYGLRLSTGDFSVLGGGVYKNETGPALGFSTFRIGTTRAPHSGT